MDDGLSDLMRIGKSHHTMASSPAPSGEGERNRHHSTCSAASLRCFELSSRLAAKSPRETPCYDDYN